MNLRVGLCPNLLEVDSWSQFTITQTDLDVVL